MVHNQSLVIDGEFIHPVLRDIVQGLTFLHASQPVIVHGDLKSQNILVDRRCRAKVTDFGLSRSGGRSHKRSTGTPFWMAPEILLGGQNTPASDVYAFGIVLSELYARKLPYAGEATQDVIGKVCDLTRSEAYRPSVPASCPLPLSTMMQDSWHQDPALRPTFEEIFRRLHTLTPDLCEPTDQVGACMRETVPGLVSECEGSVVGPLNRGQYSGSACNERLMLRVLQSLNKKRHMDQTADLLYDVFPKHVADALRAGREVEPERRDCVTIFFSDIVGFTTISSNLDPEQVSKMLHRLYTAFDELSAMHRVFKVETIGDSYMAVTNLVEDQDNDHALRMARFALGALQAAKDTLIDLDNPSLGSVRIRIGMHSGPVVANVVGTRNKRYCLFGDTVNTASRMESNSEVRGPSCPLPDLAFLPLALFYQNCIPVSTVWGYGGVCVCVCAGDAGLRDRCVPWLNEGDDPVELLNRATSRCSKYMRHAAMSKCSASSRSRAMMVSGN